MNLLSLSILYFAAGVVCNNIDTICIADPFHHIALKVPATPSDLPVCSLSGSPSSEPTAEFLSFEEWKERQLAASNQNVEPASHHNQTASHDTPPPDSGAGSGAQAVQPSEPSTSSDSTQTAISRGQMPPRVPLTDRFNYAALDCGARIHISHKSAKSPQSILSSKKDKYMLSPCDESKQFVVVELCDDIKIDTVQLANFEFFSAVFKTFRVSVSNSIPPGNGGKDGTLVDPEVKGSGWTVVGTYTAKNIRGIQSFHSFDLQGFYRYVRVDFLSHYGAEFYCPVSLLRVYGLTQMEEWKSAVWEAEWIAQQQNVPNFVPQEQRIEASTAESTAMTILPMPHTTVEAKNMTIRALAGTEVALAVITPILDRTVPSRSSPKVDSSAVSLGSSDIHDTTVDADNSITQATSETGESSESSHSTTITSIAAVTELVMSSSTEATDASSSNSDDPTPSSTLITDSAPIAPPTPPPEQSTAISSSIPPADPPQLKPDTVQSASTGMNIKTGGNPNHYPPTSGGEVPVATEDAQSQSQASPTSVSTPSSSSSTPESTSDGHSETLDSNSVEDGSVRTTSRSASPTTSSTTSASTTSTSFVPPPSPPPVAQPHVGSESIYRNIMSRLQSLELNATLYARYVEEQTKTMREALIRLKEDMGRVESMVIVQKNVFQRTIGELEKQRKEMEGQREELVGIVGALSDEILLEKRLGFVQLCLLLLVLVFVALTRGSRGDTAASVSAAMSALGISGLRRKIKMGDRGNVIGHFRRRSDVNMGSRPAWMDSDTESTRDSPDLAAVPLPDSTLALRNRKTSVNQRPTTPIAKSSLRFPVMESGNAAADEMYLTPPKVVQGRSPRTSGSRLRTPFTPTPNNMSTGSSRKSLPRPLNLAHSNLYAGITTPVGKSSSAGLWGYAYGRDRGSAARRLARTAHLHEMSPRARRSPKTSVAPSAEGTMLFEEGMGQYAGGRRAEKENLEPEMTLGSPWKEENVVTATEGGAPSTRKRHVTIASLSSDDAWVDTDEDVDRAQEESDDDMVAVDHARGQSLFYDLREARVSAPAMLEPDKLEDTREVETVG